MKDKEALEMLTPLLKTATPTYLDSIEIDALAHIIERFEELIKKEG